MSQGDCHNWLKADYYPLLLLHVGTNDTVKQDLGKIKQDFRALGAQVKRTRAHVIFSSVLPVRDRGEGRS